MQPPTALDLEVRFQPIVSACTGSAAGAEALLRGRIGGASFPPRALVRQLHHHGTSVADIVVRDIGRVFDHWAMRGEDDFWCSINLDAWDLAVGLPDIAIGELIGEDRAHRVVAEVSAIHRIDPVRGRRTLERLRGLGVRIAVDDFGVGDLAGVVFDLVEPDMVKIDRRFVARMDQPGGDRAMVQSTIALARRAGVEVVADGVSTATQLGRLSRLGCDLVQGPIAGDPMSIEHLLHRDTCRHLAG